MAADARRHGFRLAAGEEGLEVAAVAAEQEGEEAVVHEVAAVGRRRRAVGMDAEDDLRSGDLLGRAGEADEAGLAVGDVAGEQRGRQIGRTSWRERGWQCV